MERHLPNSNKDDLFVFNSGLSLFLFFAYLASRYTVIVQSDNSLARERKTMSDVRWKKEVGRGKMYDGTYG